MTIDTSHIQTSECAARLDALSESLSVAISQTPFLAIEIRDEHGIDSYRLHDMILRVLRYPMHGQLLLPTNTSTTFTLNDVVNKWVQYRFSNRTKPVTEDSFSIEVSYFHSDTVELTLNICIDPVPTPELVVFNPSISIPTDAFVQISNRTFSAVNSRGQGGEAVTYSIVHPPRWGHIVNQDNHTLLNFSQADIDQGRVFYQHLSLLSNTLTDYFIFEICTEYVCKGVHNVTVMLSVTNLTLYNNVLRVNEGGVAIITRNHLDAIAPENGVQFHVTKQPEQGTLHLRIGGYVYPSPKFFETRHIASESLWYNQTASEKSVDSFKFKVTAENSEIEISSVFSIEIIPINNKLPLLLRNEMYTIARTTRNITTEDLRAYDEDSDAVSRNLRYDVLPYLRLLYGKIHYRNDPEQNPLDSWYESEVEDGLLAYTHTRQERLDREVRDILGVRLNDRGQSAVHLVTIYINEIRLTVEQSVLEVVEGGEGRIDENLLHAVAAGDESLTESDLKFHLVSYPKNGMLTLHGEPVTNFTQADINNHGLIYVHNHSNTISDGFNYSVTIEQHGTTEMGSFKITVTAVDDDPPTLVFLHKPLFVIEGSNIYITNKHLTVIDFDTNMESFEQINQIEFQIISPPSHGVVKRSQGAAFDRFKVTEQFTLYEVNFASVLLESHPLEPFRETSDDRWFDSFLVNLTDRSGNTHPTPYNFSFVILPDIVSVVTTPFTVPEGESVVLPNDTIIAQHPYLKTQPGCILIMQPPKNGTLFNSATGEMNITNFTTADLALGHIEYHHNGAEEDRDQLKFTYEAHQPVSPVSDSQAQPGVFPETFMRTSDSQVLDILVDTVNDRGPEIRSNRILVMWAEDCAFLSTTYLDVVDADTPSNKLYYTFNFTFDAYITHINNSNSDGIEVFTQEEVVNSVIKLFHRKGERGTMYFTVTDGEFSASSQLNIETRQLELAVVRNNPLNVSMNGKVRITSDALRVRRSSMSGNFSVPRCRVIEPIEYQFEAKYGVVFAEGYPNATVFTNVDIDEGRVFYQHTKPELWESLETLTVKAKATLTKVKEFPLNISIALPSEPNSPLAVHKSLVVEERGEVCLNESILDARNVRYNTVKETVDATLTAWFYFYYTKDSHGEILVDGNRPPQTPPRVSQAQIANGSVCYRNFGDESTEDPLKFSVFIIDNGEYVRDNASDLILNISVILINDEPPTVVNASLDTAVVEGFSADIGNDSLLISDEDNPASDLVYTILNIPLGGELWLGSSHQLQEKDSFSQTMVDEGMLHFEALDIGTWKFLLSFTDGKFSDQTNFTVMVNKHFVKVNRTEVLRYSQNEQGTSITSNHIVIHTNGDVDDTMYVLIERPRNGELKGLKNDSFSEYDLKMESVSYIPTNFEAHSDSFKLHVLNRDAENQTVTIEVHVDVWGEVKQNEVLDFNSVETQSLPLPKNILSLPNLQFSLQKPPLITVTQHPKLGFLEVKISTDIPSRRSASSQNFEFPYNYLDYNWVYYTLNTTNVSLADSEGIMNDSFTVVVEGYETIQPGEATINLLIKTPSLEPTGSRPATETTPFSESTTSPPPFEEDEQSGGFPTYALLPILGVFVILLVIIIAVIVFCVTQQGRIRKRWQPRLPGHHYPHRDQSFPLHATSNFYDVEPSTQPDGRANHANGSVYEGRSPLSESPLSRYSPSISHPPNSRYPQAEVGQTYQHRHMIPRPRSRRSNVSVSYSHQPLSEVTYDEIPTNRHQMFSPSVVSHYTTPVPIRPTSAFSSEYEGEGGESGYITPNLSVSVAEEPVRLVCRRPPDEEIVPLSRLIADARDMEGGGDEEGVGDERREEEHWEEEGAVGGLGSSTPVGSDLHYEREDVNSNEPPGHTQQLLEPAYFTPAEQSATENGDAEPSQHGDAAAAPSSTDHIVLHSSDGAHAVSTPLPSEPEAPDPPPVPLASAASASASSSSLQHNSTTSSDLHTLFRTQNPILKRAEYWV